MIRTPDFDLFCLVAGLALAAAYLIGLWRISGKAGSLRPPALQPTLLFSLAWLLPLLPVVTPLHSLGHTVFWLHMVEHELLILIAAPLFVLARPGAILLWALPQPARESARAWIVGPGTRRAWAFLTRPSVTVPLHAVTLWIWHLPWLFQAALASAPMHVAQHLSFFVPALLFWWSLLSRRRRSQNVMSAMLALFATTLQTTLLGLLLTLSRTVWYPNAADPFPICGLTRIEDQQLAGLIMWVPGTIVYLAAALWLLAEQLLAGGRRHAAPPA
jgi:cytochrome c oxidase assembly factor CtaG